MPERSHRARAGSKRRGNVVGKPLFFMYFVNYWAIRSFLGACRLAAASDRVFAMADMTDRSAFDQLLRPLRRGLNAELAALLLRMQADDEVQARYEELAERNTEGQLSPAEQNELASIVRANSLLTVLKAEARAFLQHPNAA